MYKDTRHQVKNRNRFAALDDAEPCESPHPSRYTPDDINGLLAQMRQLLRMRLDERGNALEAFTEGGMEELSKEMLALPKAIAVLDAVTLLLAPRRRDTPVPREQRGPQDPAAAVQLIGCGVDFGENHETEHVTAEGDCLFNT